MAEAHQIFTDKIQKVNKSLLLTNMKLEQLEEVETKIGDKNAKLKKSCKELHLNPAKYHGGDFEGNAIQQMLYCARNQKNSLLNCISDQQDVYQKFKRALTILQEVSGSLKMPIESFDDHGINLVKTICKRWGENWLKDFPHLNITPKAHNLIFCASRNPKENQNIPHVLQNGGKGRKYSCRTKWNSAADLECQKSGAENVEIHRTV